MERKLGDNEKTKYIKGLIDEFSERPLVNICRLSFEDIPLILNFLMSVWPENYGRDAFPYFKEDYLKWVLGGPNKDRHIFMGAKKNDKLIAYQSLLYRTVSFCGNKLNTFLVTHLAISPKINLQERLYLLAQKPIFDEKSIYYEPDCDLIYAFHEENSPLRDVSSRMLKKYYDLEAKILCNFNQFMIVPKRLKNYLQQNRMEEDSSLVRTASENDSGELTKLFNEVPEGPHFIMIMTEEELRHHFFGHPNHFTSIIKAEREIKAFINFYPMEIIKEGQPSSYVMIEFLFSKIRNRRYVAMLLNEALKLSDEIGAKGIVLENATYLEFDDYREVGLMPTFRKMTMSVILKNHLVNYFGSFRCDIK